MRQRLNFSVFTCSIYAIFLTRFSYCFEPISFTGITGAILTAAFFTGWEYTKCTRGECCSDKWITPDFNGLKSSFEQKFHGQHLAKDIIYKAVKGHVLQKNPAKALVLSFNGWTGSGKNFASDVIAESLYKNGKESNFVHIYIATKHFPHQDRLQSYKDFLLEEIEKHTKFCGRNLFIFDEVDKMPVGLIDTLKPYIDYYDHVDGIDYRKNIFIFLSNSGGDAITKVALEFWASGKNREYIEIKDIEPLLNKGVFNENGGLHKSEIIERSLIDNYVPFLPLEKKHVKLCVRDELRKRNHSSDNALITKIADQLEYRPEDVNIYSISGCKKVSQKVDFFLIDL